MSTPTNLYFRGEILTDDDYFTLAEEFRVPVTALEGAVNQVKAKGSPLYSLFDSTVRERIREWFKYVSLIAPEDEPEPVVVDGLHDAQEAPIPPPVAHRASDPVATPSSATT